MKPNCLRLTTEAKILAHLNRASLFIHRYRRSHSKLRYFLFKLKPYLIPKQTVKKG